MSTCTVCGTQAADVTHSKYFDRDLCDRCLVVVIDRVKVARDRLLDLEGAQNPLPFEAL